MKIPICRVLIAMARPRHLARRCSSRILLLAGAWSFFLIADALAVEGEVVFAPQEDALPLLLDTIEGAERRITLGMFFLTHETLIDALCYQSKKRGVAVTLYLDEKMAEPSYRPLLEKMAGHGITLSIDELENRGKLHLKCAVIDGHTVLTGSANWTVYGLEKNFEDILRIRSASLAANYSRYFRSLETQCRRFTTEKALDRTQRVRRFPEIESPAESASRRRWQGGESPQSFWTPGRDGIASILERISEARSRVDLAIYLLSDEKVVDQLCAIAEESSAKIRVIVDGVMLGSRYLSKLEQMARAGIEVHYLDDSRSSQHLKVVVIDDKIVSSGSANWSTGALEKNAEDMVIISSTELAAHYREQIDRLLAEAHPYQSIVEELASEIPDADSGRGFAGPDRETDTPWPLGLPVTGERTDFSNLKRPRPSEAMKVERTAMRYLDDGEYLPTLLHLIDTAQQSILIGLYQFAWRHDDQEALGQITEALERAAQRGVYVYLLLNMPSTEQDNQHHWHLKAAERLRPQGIDVRLNVPTVPYHDKMVVVDLCKVIVGSHNWSEGAVTGKRVHESSALILYDAQDRQLADYLLGRQVVADMRSRQHCLREIRLLRHLKGLSPEERKAFTSELVQTTETNSSRRRADETPEPNTEAIAEKQVEEASRKALATLDRIILRSGVTLEGKIRERREGHYHFAPHPDCEAAVEFLRPGSRFLEIPSSAVRFALYADPARARRELGVADMARHCRDVGYPAEFLPSALFGQRVLTEIESAQESISVLTYFLSQSSSSTTQAFYEALRRKAAQGVRVELVCPFGAGANEFVKRATYDTAVQLAESGVEARFLQGNKIQHKKVIIIDEKRVLLGSSNLTLSGMTGATNDMNVSLAAPHFAAKASKDFREMFREAKKPEELKY